LEQGGTAAIFSAMLGITAVIWLFRFLWLYIPAAVNYPLVDFIKKLAPFSLSFYLIGIWLVSYVPLLLGFDLVLSMAIVALGLAPESVAVSMVYDILRIIVETALVIITTASITYGFKQLFQNNKSTRA